VTFNEDDVTALVVKFGQQLKMVSLLAPAETVKSDMDKYYGDLISPDLLSKWEAAPESAPGRMVSSPWPDRIEIQSVEKTEDNTFQVKGEIIEITSTEEPDTGVAARRPITLSVGEIDNLLLITDAMLGDYIEDSSVVYQNDKYGFTFALPDGWNGFTIVSGEWEGSAVDGQGTGQVVVTGIMLSIRHPLWTEKTPRQDIPIMIFTKDQWNQLQQDKIHIRAAPIGPSELTSNSKYVFALPARYNYAFPAGYEEVETILKNDPIKATENFNE
jgi:hypothetical protein